MFVCTVSKSLVGLGLAGTGITSGIFALPGPRPKLPSETASTQSTEISTTTTSTSSESRVATTNPTVSSPTTFISHGRTVETTTVSTVGGVSRVAEGVVVSGAKVETRGNAGDCEDLYKKFTETEKTKGTAGALKEQDEWTQCVAKKST